MSDQPYDKSHEHRLEEATIRRLVRLRTMPVELSRLQASIEAEIPRPVQQARHLHVAWLRPMRAVAASLLVLGLIAALIIASSGGPVFASTQRLLEVHQAMQSDPDHATAVQSVEAANEILAGKWRNAPKIPSLEYDQVMSCCVHRMGRQRVACVMLTLDDTPVTMAVANAADIDMPDSQPIERNGSRYHVQSSDGIQMVMTERDGRWACLMGPLPVERLVQALDSMRW